MTAKKEVRLNRGIVALVDESDYAMVSARTWYAVKKGLVTYAVSTRKDPKTQSAVYMHRLIFGAGKGVLVDHKDRNGLNNCRNNLRLASKSKNAMNAVKTASKTSSRYKGVSYKKDHGRVKRWHAYVGKPPKRKNIGLFLTEEEAARAYDREAAKRYGSFARLNFPAPS